MRVLGVHALVCVLVGTVEAYNGDADGLLPPMRVIVSVLGMFSTPMCANHDCAPLFEGVLVGAVI